MIVETADYDYEQRLVDRIALKEIVRALPYRQKDVILRRYVHGETLEEVGGRHDITRERTRQVEIQALKRLKEFATRPRRPLPPPTPPPAPKPAKPVIQEPPEDKQAIFERELQSLRRAIPEPRPAPQPTPAPPPPFWSPPYDPPSAWSWSQDAPDADQLQDILTRALQAFEFYRLPTSPGIQTVGTMCSTCEFNIAGSDIFEAMHRLACEVPVRAHLSAAEFPKPEGSPDLTVRDDYVSLRLMRIDGGRRVRIGVTWDNPSA